MARKPKPLGIQPLMIALVYEALNPNEQRMMWQADAPSLYAEARIGIAKPSEIENRLGDVVEGIKLGNSEATPYLSQWVQENRGLTIDDLAKALRKSSKKSGAMITQEGIVGIPTHSSMNSLTTLVKGRKKGTEKDTLKKWKVELTNYDLRNEKTNPNFWRNCHCGFAGSHVNRKRLWATDKLEHERLYFEKLIAEGLVDPREADMLLHLACYHEAAAITRIELENNRGAPRTIEGLEGRQTTIAYDFIDRWDLAFEALARRYKFRQDYATIDEFLFEHDIISPYFKQLMAEGDVHREVIKKSRHFDSLGEAVMKRLHRRMLEHGYKYKGYAREFMDVGNKRKKYKTVGIVYEKGDVSFHVVYDNTFWAPFVVEKKITGTESKKRLTPYQRNPAKRAIHRRAWTELDDRTGKVAKTWVHRPQPGTVKGIPGVESAYRRYFARF
jgi:hypothetical protein